MVESFIHAVRYAFGLIPPWLWHSALVAFVAGLAFLPKKAWKRGFARYHALRDRPVLMYIKETKGPGCLYNVEEIATALNKRQRDVMTSLRRLREQEHVSRYSEDGTGLWGLHESEEISKKWATKKS
jgi:hypothetical protein